MLSAVSQTQRSTPGGFHLRDVPRVVRSTETWRTRWLPGPGGQLLMAAERGFCTQQGPEPEGGGGCRQPECASWGALCSMAADGRVVSHMHYHG